MSTHKTAILTGTFMLGLCEGIFTAHSHAIELDSHCIEISSHNTARCQLSQLTLYVGPQSVVAGEPVYVALEALSITGQSIPAGHATLRHSYKDGVTHMGISKGLGHTEIVAPVRTGRMTLRAKAGTVRSNEAEVLVLSGPIAPFSVSYTQHDGTLRIETDVIKDVYGNRLENGISARVNYWAQDSLKATEIRPTIEGRVTSQTACEGMSRITIQIKDVVENISLDDGECGTGGRS